MVWLEAASLIKTIVVFGKKDEGLVISEPERNVCFRLYIPLRLIKELIRYSKMVLE